MKKRILLLQIVAVILIGEALFRFDEMTFFFKGARFEFLENEPRMSAVRNALDEGTFDPDPKALRMMLVGDSFLFGGKANEDYIFSHQIRRLLKADNVPGYEGAYVLDLSTPGANTIVNHRNFLAYVDRFRPDVLMWVYSRNDVYAGREDDDGEGGGGDEEEPERSSGDPRVLDRLNRVVRDTQIFFFRHMKTLRWALKSVNTELKLQGVLVPGTQHYHLIKRSHAPDFGPWKRSQPLLEEMALACRERGIFVLVFNTPYLHMLSNYGIYEEQDRVIGDYFRGLGVSFLNGVDPFMAKNPDGEYAISRFDLHPNEAAHTLMAETIHRYLVERVPPRTEEERAGG